MSSVTVKKSKNQLRREKAKLQKQSAKGNDKSQEKDISKKASTDTNGSTRRSQLDSFLSIETDNVPEYFQQVFDKFIAEETIDSTKRNENIAGEQIFYSDDEDHGSEDNRQSDQTMHDGEATDYKTKQKSKKRQKISLAELKAHAPKPELVEWYDADAPDPELVVLIKAIPGVVPVPDHWQQKKDYLSSRRGILKAPFDLPDFIKATGIMEMKDALKEDESTIQQRTRERVQPKMGQLDIDYQKLHDAFFKFQTKPKLYGIGDVYYENKEKDVDLDRYRPGILSKKLKTALNIPPGAPPPWLLSMQRYGPPPSYPDLAIPGLNAPIPSGAQWGFHPGGYGRPPLNKDGEPLYGDVYGDSKKQLVIRQPDDHANWGLMIDGYDVDQDEEEEEEEEAEASDESDEGEGYVDEDAALAPDSHENRSVKRQRLEEETQENESEDEDAPAVVNLKDQLTDSKPLYTVLEPKKETGGFLGEQAAYHIPTTSEVNESLNNLMRQGRK